MGCITPHKKVQRRKSDFVNLGVSHNTLSRLHIAERTRTVDLKSNNFTNIINISYIRRLTDSKKKILKKNVKEVKEITLDRIKIERSNSCSTVQIKGVLTNKPELDICLKSAAYAYYLFLQRDKLKEYPYIFKFYDELEHPVNVDYNGEIGKGKTEEDLSSNLATGATMLNNIYHFLKYIFINLCLDGENVIAFMVFVDRMRVEKNFIFNMNTWRRAAIGTTMLASKLLDDHAIWNEDMAKVLENNDIDDLNKLEQQTFKNLNYNLHIPGGVYTTYYLELKTLGEASGILNNDAEYLTTEKAKELHMLERYENKFLDSNIKSHKKSCSNGEVYSASKTRSVIIS